MTEKTLLKRIEINPDILLGKPVIKGTRLPVELLVEKVAYGSTYEEILESYPFLKVHDIQASLLYAARTVSQEENILLD